MHYFCRYIKPFSNCREFNAGRTSIYSPLKKATHRPCLGEEVRMLEVQKCTHVQKKTGHLLILKVGNIFYYFWFFNFDFVLTRTHFWTMRKKYYCIYSCFKWTVSKKKCISTWNNNMESYSTVPCFILSNRKYCLFLQLSTYYPLLEIHCYCKCYLWF